MYFADRARRYQTRTPADLRAVRVNEERTPITVSENRSATCRKCGASAGLAGDPSFCPICGHPLLSDNTAPSHHSRQSSGVPWENAEQSGLVEGFLLTLRESLLSPDTFFPKTTRSAALLQPLLFAAIMGAIETGFGYLWNSAIPLHWPSSSSQLFSSDLLNHSTTSLIGLLFSPLTAIVVTYIAALYVHPLLVVTRTGQGSFTSTVVMLCYCQSAGIAQAVPFVGGIASAVWGFWMVITGIAAVRGTSKLRAALVILAPAVLIVGSAVFLVVLALTAGFAFQGILKDFLPFYR